MTAYLPSLERLPVGSHVGWFVKDNKSYLERATSLLLEAAESGEKPVLFGPDGDPTRDRLAPLAAQVADPRTAFLGGGPLDPDAMFAMFHEQVRIAREDGYRGLRVVADMDWLLPLRPTAVDILAFELMLDRHAFDLGATIVCAYRAGSFDLEAITGTMCVHPVEAGSDQPAVFRLVAAAEGTWQLSGEVDLAVATEFSAAVTAALKVSPCVVDASRLEFIDIAGMRALASAARASVVPLRVIGAPQVLRRSWQLAGFDRDAPLVDLVA